jgi:hypothetical protein
MTESQHESYSRFLENIQKDKKKAIERAIHNESVFVDINGDIVVLDKKNTLGTSDFFYKDLLYCLEYKEKPWIKNYDKEYYVSGILESKEIQETGLVKKDDFITFDNKQYYKSTDKLNELLCDTLSKIQTEDILSGEFKNKKVFKFEIVYKLKNEDFLKQNEKIFNDELNWIAARNNELLYIKQNVKKFFDEEVVEKDTKFSKYIMELLNQYFDKESSIKIENYFIEESKGNMNYFMERIAKLMVFLDSNYLGNLLPYFHQKLSKNVYNLEDIYTLSEKEILQEVYENPKNYDDDDLFGNSKIELLANSIKDQIDNYIFNTVKNFIKDPSKRQWRDEIKHVKRINVDLITDSLQCKNEFGDIDWDTIYYRDPETNELYCYKLADIVSQIHNGDIVNSYTNRQFSNDFIKKISKYSYEKIEESQKIETPLEINILDVLLQDLNKKEIDLQKSDCSKDKIKNYYREFVLSDNSLERKLNKSSNDIENINNYVLSSSLNTVSKKEDSPSIYIVENPSYKKVQFNKTDFGKKKNRFDL